MSLWFKPRIFKDRFGEEIELDGIEIFSIYVNRDETMEIGIRSENSQHWFDIFQIHDIQKEIQRMWNAEGMSFLIPRQRHLEGQPKTQKSSSHQNDSKDNKVKAYLI